MGFQRSLDDKECRVSTHPLRFAYGLVGILVLLIRVSSYPSLDPFFLVFFSGWIAYELVYSLFEGQCVFLMWIFLILSLFSVNEWYYVTDVLRGDYFTLHLFGVLVYIAGGILLNIYSHSRNAFNNLD